MCNKCKKQNTICIKEPADADQWLCRGCYTGLSPEQMKRRYGELIGIMTAYKEKGPVYVTELAEIPDEDIPF